MSLAIDQVSQTTPVQTQPVPSVGNDNAPARAGELQSPAAQLADQVRATFDPVQQGVLLRELDTLTGGRAQTDALLAGQAAPGQQAAAGGGKAPAPQFDASSLYGSSGQPQLSDIRQSNFGDCYYVATLGAVANQSPDTIRNAISYDANTQSFNVRLHDTNGNAQTVNVTQAEITSNIAQGGGSHRDDGVANAPVWPDVMEVAYAKMLDTNHADGLSQGYTDLGDGGWPKDGMEAITGSEGTEVKFDQGWFESRSNALDEVGTQITDALANGQPVTAWTVPSDGRSLWGKLTGETPEKDGLVDNHVYTVTGISKDANGDWQVTMRNPWSHNNVGEGKDSNSAYVTMPLDSMVQNGGLDSFRVGQ